MVVVFVGVGNGTHQIRRNRRKETKSRCWEWNGDNIQENVANLPSHSIQSYRLNSNVARYHRIQISFELLCTVRTYVCYVLPYEYAYYHTIAVTSSHFLFFYFQFYLCFIHLIIACHTLHTHYMHFSYQHGERVCLVPFIITRITTYRWIQWNVW